MYQAFAAIIYVCAASWLGWLAWNKVLADQFNQAQISYTTMIVLYCLVRLFFGNNTNINNNFNFKTPKSNEIE